MARLIKYQRQRTKKNVIKKSNILCYFAEFFPTKKSRANFSMLFFNCQNKLSKIFSTFRNISLKFFSHFLPKF